MVSVKFTIYFNMRDCRYNKLSLDTVISSFPQRQDGPDDLDHFSMTDVFESIYSKLGDVQGPFDLLQTIVKECSDTFFDRTRYLQEDFRFLDMFENSIGTVVSLI